MQKKQESTFKEILKKCFANDDYDSKKNQEQCIEEIRKLKLRQVEANDFIDSFSQIIAENAANPSVIVLQNINYYQQFAYSCQNTMKQVMEWFFQTKPLIQKALFFPSQDSEQEMIRYIKKAQNTLDICVFTITNNHFANQIFLLFHSGVKVRIITDDEQAKSLGADIIDLAKAGIPVRIDDDARSHMHNKFAIIDSLVLINGSFNWTMAAATKNQENVTILESKVLIEQYEEEFEKLWKQFRSTQIEVEKDVPYRFKKLLH